MRKKECNLCQTASWSLANVKHKVSTAHLSIRLLCSTFIFAKNSVHEVQPDSLEEAQDKLIQEPPPLVSESVLRYQIYINHRKSWQSNQSFFPLTSGSKFFSALKVTGIMGRAWIEGHRKHGKGRIKLDFHLFRNSYF
uniref:Uncharacterized protein n=1 Tax=Micrurus lemniscatus lemniscatus TaxID=129467 RepID=A0A2D4IZV4_MICLE